MASGNHGGRGTFRGPSAWGGGGSGGGGGGAPTDGPYVTTASSAGLSNETLIGAIILPPDIFANRPSAAALVDGTLFYATDTLDVYRVATGAWVTAQTGVAPKASPTFTGVPITPTLSVTGLTGATAGGRFVGHVASGPPVSGTFILNDWCISLADATVYVCTVAGTPGTWTPSVAGRELGYTEVTSNQTGITGVGTANKVAVTSLSTTVTVGTRPILIKARTGNSLNTTADNGGGIAIVDTADTTTLLAQGSGFSVAANAGFSLHVECRKAPAAGSKTYAVYAWAVVGGSFTFTAGTQNPAFIQVIEL